MTGDYTTDILPDRVKATKAKWQLHIDDRLDKARHRADQRKQRLPGWPLLCLVGMGRAGKDTSAIYLCDKLGLQYESTSKTVLPYIADSIGVPQEMAYAERHQHREFWKAWCDEFRRGQPLLLAQLSLAEGDMVVGVRGAPEFHAVRRELVDCTLWIDNPRVPPDFTVDFGAVDCDFMVPNHAGITQLYERLDKLITLFTTRSK